PNVSARRGNRRYIGSYEPSVDFRRRLAAPTARDCLRLILLLCAALGEIAFLSSRRLCERRSRGERVGYAFWRWALYYRLLRSDLTAVS
ncbi:MAG: hypothetical protein J6X44_02620, partial [Thermoguttaceae bacterium]|nr:hypothetical protein [Thermoguttaceae bacterium]